VSTEAFLSAIRETPDDDLHRLVYADWLDDHGDSDRAEFIRIQCRLATLSEYDRARDELEVRERELLTEHEREWVRGLPKEVCSWRFRRGFVDEVTLPPGVFLREWEELLDRHPVTSVRFPPGGEEFPAAELAGCPGLERLSGLEMNQCGLDEMDKGVEQLLTSPRLHRMRRLGVAENGLCYVGGGYLAKNPALAGLEELDFSGWGLDEPDSENALACFTGSKVLTNLRRLRLRGSRNEPEVLLGLNGAPFRDRLELLDLLCSGRYDFEDEVSWLRLSRLRSLSLHGETLGETGATALLESPHLPALAALDLSYPVHRWNTPPEVPTLLRSVVQSSGWVRLKELALCHARLLPSSLRDLLAVRGNLERLDLSGNSIGGGGVQYLASLPWLSSISWLGLEGVGANDESVAAISASPSVANLRLLRLGGNGSVTAQGARRLARSPHLGRLVELDLASLPLRGVDMEAFAGLPRLTRLGLSETELGGDDIRRLAKCPWLARITHLDLGENREVGDGLRWLAESPYLSSLCELDIRSIDADSETHTMLRGRLGWRLKD
jgi:uncharacterized protein (TIGR02996 family)